MRTYLLISLLLLCVGLGAQTLPDFNQTRLDRQRNAMLVLGTWAVGNLAAGAVLQGQRTGEDRYFHRMNAYWNGINLLLAGSGLYTALTTDPAGMDLIESLRQQGRLEKILLFNAGLDVGYMLGGAYLMERARRPDQENPERLRGFGKSIVLQGAFLFAFDLGAYFYLHQDPETVPGLLGAVQLSGDGLGMVWRF